MEQREEADGRRKGKGEHRAGRERKRERWEQTDEKERTTWGEERRNERWQGGKVGIGVEREEEG